jgi:hypothetical protein
MPSKSKPDERLPWHATNCGGDALRVGHILDAVAGVGLEPDTLRVYVAPIAHAGELFLRNDRAVVARIHGFSTDPADYR